MFKNDRRGTASKSVTSVRHRIDIVKYMRRTHRHFVDFQSRIHIEISTSNRCHNFHVNSPFILDEISTNFPRGISRCVHVWLEELIKLYLMPNLVHLTTANAISASIAK